MSDKPTPEQLEQERAALTGLDAVIYELVRQRGELKLCYDDEDGWFVQALYNRHADSFVTLDDTDARHASPTAAIEMARLAHNAQARHPNHNYRCVIEESAMCEASIYEQEGWCLFDVDSTGLMEIERDDEADVFNTDEAALAFVRHRAEYSDFHRKAIEAHDRDAEELRKHRGGEKSLAEELMSAPADVQLKLAEVSQKVVRSQLAEALVRGQMREEFLKQISDKARADKRHVEPSIREDRVTGQFVPTLNGKDTSPTSFDEERAMEIAQEQADKANQPEVVPPGEFRTDTDQWSDVLSAELGRYQPHTNCHRAITRVIEAATDSGLLSAKYCEGADPTLYCPAFSLNWSKIDRGLRMAAMNGTATNADSPKYCPWCGGLLAQRKVKKEDTASR